jgi:hypothetical protein
MTGARGGRDRCLSGIGRASLGAARLLGAADAVYGTADGPATMGPSSNLEQAEARVRADLGNERFKVAWAERQAMGLQDALAHALEESALT